MSVACVVYHLLIIAGSFNAGIGVDFVTPRICRLLYYIFKCIWQNVALLLSFSADKNIAGLISPVFDSWFRLHLSSHVA